ncbi:MAG: mannose-6-phosphate isomerase, class I [Clostridia bacterium]|nr:mannose-6-phosphate isomerase, class I [Clostridia bacterium]
MDNILFLKPVFHEKIWGGNKLNSIFGYDIPSEKTGECWAISAHPNGDCEILNRNFKGWNLSKLWKDKPELFGNLPLKQFPLLVKIIDACDDLSVQVHPNDEQAKLLENESNGKTECWYVLHCEESSKLVYGHNATTKAAFIDMIDRGKYKELLEYRNIKEGDFYFVPAGTIHGIGSGTLIYEVQQPSDVTYRLYDYDRVDSNGKHRDLHLDKSKEVVNVPHRDISIMPEVKKENSVKVTTYISNEYFEVRKLSIHSYYSTKNDKPFLLCTVIDGEGLINGITIKAGDNFIVTSQCNRIDIEGKLEIITSNVME